MDLVNCKDCGRTFASESGEAYCRRCRNKNVENEFKIVREYLYDHPGATVAEVSEETGVAETIIMKFLRDERLEIIEDENALLSCQKCGKSIKTGKLCDSCKNEMKSELTKVLREMDPPKPAIKDDSKKKVTMHIYKDKDSKK